MFGIIVPKILEPYFFFEIIVPSFLELYLFLKLFIFWNYSFKFFGTISFWKFYQQILFRVPNIQIGKVLVQFSKRLRFRGTPKRPWWGFKTHPGGLATFTSGKLRNYNDY